MSLNFLTRRGSTLLVDISMINYRENILDEYQNAWDVSPSINNENRRSCEQKLIKLDKKTLVCYLQQFQSWGFYPFIKQTEKKYVPCVLLHLIHVFSIPGQEEKMKEVQVELNKVLHTMTEEVRYDIFERYICQQLKVKSSLTEIDLLTGQIESQHEFQMKLCYWDTFCAKNDKEGCKEFLKKNADFLVSKIEARATNLGFMWHIKLNLIACNILLCLLNWNIFKTRNPVILQNNRKTPAPSSVSLVADPSTNYSFTNRASNMLQKILSTLSEEKIFKAFNDYLEQMYAMNSEITEDDFCSNKIEPYHECMLKLCYCTGKWSKTEVDFITKNTEFFLSMVEEVNKRNQLRVKFKMCQVLSIIMNGKIHIPEPMIFSVTKMHINDEYSGRLTDLLSIKLIDTNRIIACIFHLKTELNNLKTLTEKISIQYQDHIKELLLSLLADMLTLLSTQEINKAFYLSLKKSCVLNPNIMLELAKTFLDISINPKISHEKKIIIGSKIQQTLITRDTSKTALPPSDEFADSTEIKLDHKRIINICINIVKTEMKDINIPMYEGFFCTERKTIDNEVEMEKRSQETEALVLLMLLLITITSTGHHKSAKLKKYLTLKYEYATASLHLLWCSGDIEVHPGPSLNKKALAHDSTIERRWIQNISPKILILLPEHEQSKYKPTKKVRNDRENREHFKLLKTRLEEKVHVPKMYLAEINAWETMEYTTLHKLFVYRCEIETIIASLQDFFICGGSTKDLTDINVSLDTELKTNDITTILGKDHRPTDKSQLMVYITRHIAGISIKCAHGKDPDAKWDGLWDLPLKNWPNDIILFDPNNRGKYTIPGQKLIPDLELVDILLTLPQVTIPQKYKDIVDAFRTMRKSKKDKSKNKQHKAELCTTFKRITSLEKLNYALKNLWESGIFTEEVHNNLNKWWTTGAVDNQNLSQVDIKDAEKKRQPHILMNISTKSLTLTVEQSDANSSQVSYDFPLKDELVPLKTMATTVLQTTIQKPSIDSYQQKVTPKIYLTVSPLPNACPADIHTNSIFIPSDAMTVLNSYFPLEIYPNSQAILESDIKYQHKISSQETAIYSTIKSHQPISSTNQFSQLNKNTAIFGQPGPILRTPNQSTTNSDDISSATKDCQNPNFHMQDSPTSDIGSSDSISSGNEERDQNNTSNGGQDQLTDSDYSSDSSNNCDSKTSLKKRKCIEEDRIEMKKRKILSLKQDKKQSDPTSHRKIDSSMDNSITSNKDMELLLDYLDNDLDSFDIDDQTFDVEMNALDNEDKNLEICDKDGNLMNDETQISNKNTTVSAYDTNVSTILEKFVQDIINKEHEKCHK